MEYINWLPTTVTVLLLGALIWLFRTKVTKLETDYMTKEQHTNLCKIAHLEIKEGVAQEIKELKEDYLEKKFERIMDAIQENGR